MTHAIEDVLFEDVVHHRKRRSTTHGTCQLLIWINKLEIKKSYSWCYSIDEMTVISIVLSASAGKIILFQLGEILVWWPARARSGGGHRTKISPSWKNIILPAEAAKIMQISVISPIE